MDRQPLMNENDSEDFFWVEELSFPLPGQMPPPKEAILDGDDREVYLFKYGKENLIYGVPTYNMIGLKLL